VCQLKEQVMDHVHSGCQIMVSAHFWTEDSPEWNRARRVRVVNEYPCLLLYGFGFLSKLRCNWKSQNCSGNFCMKWLCGNLYIVLSSDFEICFEMPPHCERVHDMLNI
jgi:hypothetical protein